MKDVVIVEMLSLHKYVRLNDAEVLGMKLNLALSWLPLSPSQGRIISNYFKNIMKTLPRPKMSKFMPTSFQTGQGFPMAGLYITEEDCSRPRKRRIERNINQIKNIHKKEFPRSIYKSHWMFFKLKFPQAATLFFSQLGGEIPQVYSRNGCNPLQSCQAGLSKLTWTYSIAYFLFTNALHFAHKKCQCGLSESLDQMV